MGSGTGMTRCCHPLLMGLEHHFLLGTFTFILAYVLLMFDFAKTPMIDGP